MEEEKPKMVISPMAVNNDVSSEAPTLFKPPPGIPMAGQWSLTRSRGRARRPASRSVSIFSNKLIFF